MIEGGELTPDCNFEVEWSNYEENSIKIEEDLFKILKEFLWHRCDRDVETWLMLDLNITDKEGTPLSSVSVYLEKTITGTTSNDNGDYVLNIKKTQNQLKILVLLDYSMHRDSFKSNER